MPAISCPVSGCEYVTDDVDPAIVVQLLQMHSMAEHCSPQAAKVEKVKRPTLSAGGSGEDWSYFITRWQEYKSATKVTGQEKIIQLLECCEDSLRRDLTRSTATSLTEATEEFVLDAIRKLAVREENAMVARFTLHKMTQDNDEPIRAFGARIKGQANVCKFVTKCNKCKSDVQYTDEILRDVLARGLNDGEIQLDLLGNPNQEMTLEEMFKFIEAKEAGKRSAVTLTHSQGAAAAHSSYRRNKAHYGTINNTKTETNNESSLQGDCSYCGKKGHGRKAPPHIRKKLCPAFDQTCRKCNKLHHFMSMCRSKLSDSRIAAINEEGEVFQTLCSISSTPTQTYATNDTLTSSASQNSKQVTGHPLTLDHHLYDQMSNCWRSKASRSQPTIKLAMSAVKSDYEALGFQLMATTKTATLPVMADTGCQCCLASISMIQHLGLHKNDLVPVSMKMHAANNKGISILGAAILRITGTDQRGKALETRQVVYVTDESDKIFLSREACISLGMITDKFPTVGEVLSSISCQDLVPTTTGQRPCSCPRRQSPPPLPEKLPFPPTVANVPKLKEWLVNHYSSSTFNTCAHQPLKKMNGPPMRLMLDPHAEPTAYHKAIPVPIHWREKVKASLEQDVRLGVIEPVPIGEPVTWCHRMIVCAKKNGEPRRTVDFRALNTYAKRETHYTQSPFHQARSVPAQKKKSVLDAWNGYHSVPLHEDDRHYTTFITPWGRYRYCVAPQGYIASGDSYTRRYDQIIADSKLSYASYTKCIDDTLIWSDDIENNFFQVAEWLNMCGLHGITLNPKKFVFAEDNTEFAGFEITPDAVQPCGAYLRAIAEFPTPQNITDVRAWFGVVNQVSYSFSMADKMLPFRQLLKPSTPFQWNGNLDALFKESKIAIVNDIKEGVRIFDKNKPTCLATDWSKTGIGFWLVQKHCHCPGHKPFCCKNGWKTTLIGSRFTHPAESRYAPIEGEALAVADALDKARYFVLGCEQLTIAVDHKPLLKIFSDRSLEDIPNTRLRNLKEKTLRYKFRIVHIPGVRNKLADSVSRYPSGPQIPEKLRLGDDVASISSPYIEPSFLAGIRTKEAVYNNDIDDGLHHTATLALACVAITWEKVREATSSDETMNTLLQLIEQGLPQNRHMLPVNLQEYHHLREDLYTVDGVIIYRERVVIPPQLRSTVLQTLHSAHQGVTSMIARAESSVFWPGITSAIRNIRALCHQCNKMAPSQPSAPPMPTTTPLYPFQCICADYFQYHGRTYLVIVDRYSNWPIIETASGHEGLIGCLRRTFATFGIPDELASDGGPEFTATSTKKFLHDWGVHHRLSSVAFPHSNCRAEVGVKTVKRLIATNTGPQGELNTDALQRAILQYRNTPDPGTKISPALCIFGRPIKDFIPILPGRYRPHPTWRETLENREEALRNRHMKMAERWSEHTKRLPPLRIGQHVRVQNQVGPNPNRWDKTGIVVEVRQFDQYVVRIDGSGRVTLRNRKFLRQYEPVVPPRQRPRNIEDDLLLLAPTPVSSQDREPADMPDSSTQPPPATEVTPTQQQHLDPPPGEAISYDDGQLTERPQHALSRPTITPSTQQASPQRAPRTPDVEDHNQQPRAERIQPQRNRRAPAWHRDYIM